ncbi:MAG: single-stranded-DNA-specific exonuclease RecJ [Clostridium sp.]|nr:single-stranded-DNA-specific exonuclease RecJ [Clostridium sp.]
MENQWFVAAKKADFNAIAQKFHIDPVLARIIRNRDVKTEEEIARFLNGTLQELPDPFLLPDMERAVTKLFESREKKIRIIGDYDIDGVCATYILYRGLCSFSMQADTAIPHRMTDGYGLNDRLVEEAHRDGVGLLLTCDNGIAAAPQAELAASYGMEMIVTDHHEVPYEEKEDGSREYLLPRAAAIVDPKREDSRYPYAGICGAAVAFQLIRAMYLRKKDTVQDAACGMPQELFQELAAFAAFATIGDVMELREENRVLVREGLRIMAHTENPGLKALIAVNDLTGKTLTPYHVGFILGPCLNATGRLDSAQRALSLFTCDDDREALVIAQELKGLNDSRKDMTLKGAEQAAALVKAMDVKQNPVFVLYLPDCHESLAGIIAGRIRERFHHPVFVLTDAEDGVKGSGRSIEAYSMYEEMSRCKELFTRFGGHKMAAGLSLPKENVEPFRRRINELSTLTEEDFVQKIHIDMPMPLSYVTKELTEQLKLLEPFGTGNPKPLFAQKNLTFLSAKPVGKNDRVMRFGVLDEQNKRFAMTLFSAHEPFDAYIRENFGDGALSSLYEARGNGVSLSVVYYPEIHEYGGRSEVQFVIVDYKKVRQL